MTNNMEPMILLKSYEHYSRGVFNPLKARLVIKKISTIRKQIDEKSWETWTIGQYNGLVCVQGCGGGGGWNGYTGTTQTVGGGRYTVHSLWGREEGVGGADIECARLPWGDIVCRGGYVLGGTVHRGVGGMGRIIGKINGMDKYIDALNADRLEGEDMPVESMYSKPILAGIRECSVYPLWILSYLEYCKWSMQLRGEDRCRECVQGVEGMARVLLEIIVPTMGRALQAVGAVGSAEGRRVEAVGEMCRWILGMNGWGEWNQWRVREWVSIFREKIRLEGDEWRGLAREGWAWGRTALKELKGGEETVDRVGIERILDRLNKKSGKTYYNLQGREVMVGAGEKVYWSKGGRVGVRAKNEWVEITVGEKVHRLEGMGIDDIKALNGGRVGVIIEEEEGKGVYIVGRRLKRVGQIETKEILHWVGAELKEWIVDIDNIRDIDSIFYVGNSRGKIVKVVVDQESVRAAIGLEIIDTVIGVGRLWTLHNLKGMHLNVWAWDSEGVLKKEAYKHIEGVEWAVLGRPISIMKRGYRYLLWMHFSREYSLWVMHRGQLVEVRGRSPIPILPWGCLESKSSLHMMGGKMIVLAGTVRGLGEVVAPVLNMHIE